MIKVYTKSNCSYCVQAKTLLDLNHVKYEEISLDDPKILQEFKTNNPTLRTAPQIFVKNPVDSTDDWVNLGGYMELSRYHRSCIDDPDKDIYGLFVQRKLHD